MGRQAKNGSLPAARADSDQDPTRSRGGTRTAGRHGQCINALDPVYNEFFLCAPVRARNPRGQGQWTLRDACLRFLADSAVPFTNNGAEQAVRMAKPRMKISGGFRTRAGAERLARMRGLVETARQRQQNLLELLWQGPDIPVPQPNPVPP